MLALWIVSWWPCGECRGGLVDSVVVALWRKSSNVCAQLSLVLLLCFTKVVNVVAAVITVTESEVMKFTNTIHLQMVIYTQLCVSMSPDKRPDCYR